MGDPKFSRRKYEKPKHPWEGARIKAENELIKKYGLKNKKELWRAQSLLRNFRQRSRTLQAKVRYKDMQAGKEKDELLRRLGTMGLLPLEGATLNDVLSLDVEAILSRRLQTVAYIKGLAYSPKQARQLIVHGHTVIGDRKVTIPGYLVKRDEENMIGYSSDSPLAHDLHPARPDMEKIAPPQKEKEEKVKAEKKPEPEPEPKPEPEAKAEKDAKPEPEAKAEKDAKPEPEAPKKEEK